MSDTTSVKQGFAVGTSIGAAVILVTVGIVQFFQGLAAVAENEVFVVGIDYVYQFDLTTWGWIHLVLGALVALVGLALFTGTAWARVSAVVICAISIIANFLWLPYYPWWSTHHRAEHRRDLGCVDMEAHPDDARCCACTDNADSICLS